PVQEWGEEFEDGAVYGVTLRREPVPCPPDPGEDSPCCAFVQYRTCKVRRLKAASLDLLVKQLLDPGCQEQDYARIFLSTYRTFTGTAELIERLFHRVNPDLETNDCPCVPPSPVLTLVQTWMDEYSEDFRDPPLHPALRLLLDHLRISAAVYGDMRTQPNFSSLAGQAAALLHTLQNQETETNAGPAQEDLDQEEEASGDEDSGCENVLDHGGIRSFSAAAVAEQLTRTDSALFARVVPYQCLGCVWSQRDKKENMSPTIRATVAQFNAVTNQVIVSLLCPPTDASSSPTPPGRPPSTPPGSTPPSRPGSTPAQRARVIEKWVRVAQGCRRLKNFSSLRAILSALQSNAVYRLRKTWAAVSRQSMATFDNLWETFPDENCVLTNRELLLEDGGPATADNVSPKISKRCPFPRQTSTSSGVVPYLGTYLTVLTMLDTALPDTVEVKKLLTVNDGSKNVPADQISVSSSGSSGSEIEDPSSPNSASHIRLQVHCGCVCVRVRACLITLSSSSLSSSSCSSATFPPDSPPPTSSSSDRRADLCSPSGSGAEPGAPSSAPSGPPSGPPSGAGARPKPPPASHHKRSVSMTSLPVYNRQVGDSCIVRVSVDLGHSNGNMYKSILPGCCTGPVVLARLYRPGYPSPVVMARL
ncbi:hypothetical protein FQN60_004289, partial [Etheostoma spectabile]